MHCCAEELEKVLNRLKLSQDSAIGDDVFNDIISLLDCEGKSCNLLGSAYKYSFCLAGSFFQSFTRFVQPLKSIVFFAAMLYVSHVLLFLLLQVFT